MNNTPIFNILCSHLPSSVTQPMSQEYEKRAAEIERIWRKPNNNYAILENSKSTVYSLLAISIFYKYVLGHIEGATGFYQSLNNNISPKMERSIRFGTSLLDKKQYNHMKGVVIAFRQIKDKFQITNSFFEFSETIQFLRKCRDLYNMP